MKNHILEKNVTLAQIKNLGAAMGQIHSLLKSFRPKEISSKEDYTVEYIKKILLKIKKQEINNVLVNK